MTSTLVAIIFPRISVLQNIIRIVKAQLHTMQPVFFKIQIQTTQLHI